MREAKKTRQEFIDGNYSFTSLREELLSINQQSNIYIHTQSTPATVWEITHNLNRYIDVIIYDNENDVVYAGVKRIDNNSIRITFSEVMTGAVVCR